MTAKTLLDTDIGSDIDDAVCLAYLLAQPECNLLGITTVSGEGKKRAMLASALCKVAGKDTPIFPGAEEPLLISQRQPRAPQARALSNWAHDTRFPTGQAVHFLRQTIRENPGEITLLTIGPLTNIALLFAIDPEIPRLLKDIVMMGGHYVPRLAGIGPLEWNAICDPHAIAKVFMSPAHVRAVGLEITCQVQMDAVAVRERFQKPLLQPVLDFAEIWFEERDHITFHDPLAAATLFDEQVCAFERGAAEVELTSPRLQGFTYWQADTPASWHEIAVSVDRRRFFENFFGVFGERGAPQ